MSLYYRTYGDDLAQPVIILHGLFGSSDNWKSIATQLSSNFRVVTVDLRNHGQSFHHAEMNYELLAMDIVQLLTELDIDQANFIGHSMGGKVVMKLGVMYPEKVMKQLVIDMSPRSYDDQHTYIIDTLSSINLNDIKTRNDADLALSVSIKDKSIRQFLLMNLKVEDESFSWKINLSSLKKNYSLLLEQIDIDKNKITFPSYFIRGSKSNYITDSDTNYIKRCYENVRIITIDGAGHWVHAESPKLFLEKVSEALAA